MLFLTDNEDELLEQIPKSRWRHMRRTFVAWARPRRPAAFSSVCIAIHPVPGVNCSINTPLDGLN